MISTASSTPPCPTSRTRPHNSAATSARATTKPRQSLAETPLPTPPTSTFLRNLLVTLKVEQQQEASFSSCSPFFIFLIITDFFYFVNLSLLFFSLSLFIFLDENMNKNKQTNTQEDSF